jgi:hypothetical protein
MKEQILCGIVHFSTALWNSVESFMPQYTAHSKISKRLLIVSIDNMSGTPEKILAITIV